MGSLHKFATDLEQESLLQQDNRFRATEVFPPSSEPRIASGNAGGKDRSDPAADEVREDCASPPF